MARTKIDPGEQIQPGEITRAHLNSGTAGSAVCLRILAGSGISLTYTGADSGTGDVTVAAAGGSTSYIYRGHISGLVMANNGTTPTTDIDITVGEATDTTVADVMALASTLTKRLSTAWAVGSGNGGLDTGSVATSTWYYVWLIRRSDTGVVDALFSTSATSPTMPANYDAKRLLGSIKTDGSSNILAFTAYETAGSGVDVLWSSPPLDINLANTLTTTRRTDTLSVPPAYSVEAKINVAATDATGGFVWIYCPDQSDLTPGTSAAPLASIPAESSWSTATMAVRTTSGTVASRSSVASVDAYRVATLGWSWSRR